MPGSEIASRKMTSAVPASADDGQRHGRVRVGIRRHDTACRAEGQPQEECGANTQRAEHDVEYRQGLSREWSCKLLRCDRVAALCTDRCFSA